MKKNSIFNVITIILVIFLISGCSALNKKPKEIGDDPTSGDLNNIRSGTEGLSMRFAQNVPPDQIYDSELLSVMVELRNKGAETIKDGYLYIGGVDPNIVPFDVEGYGLAISDFTFDGNIPGKDELRGSEGEAVATFEAQLNGLPAGTDVYEPRIIVTACYEYKTIASPIVCVDPNPFGVYTSSKACEPKSVSGMGGQGGPIAITSVEQTPSRGKVQFKIHVANKGRGKAMADEIYDTCTRVEPSMYAYVNKIDDYSVSLGGITPTKCQPEELRLTDEQGVIICSFDLDQDVPAYTVPLEVTMDYNYMESTDPKKIRILKI